MSKRRKEQQKDYERLLNITNSFKKRSEAKFNAQYYPKLLEENAPIIIKSFEQSVHGAEILEKSGGDLIAAFELLEKEAETIKKKPWLITVFRNESLWKSLIIPVVLIFVTALATHYVGRKLQTQSFKNESYFEMQLEALKQGRELAIAVQSQSKYLIRLINAREYSHIQINNQYQVDPTRFRYQKQQIDEYQWEEERKELNKTEIKLSELKGFVQLFDEKQVIVSKIDQNIAVLVDLSGCIGRRSNCYDEFKTRIFNGSDSLTLEFTKAAVSLVKSKAE